MPKFTFNKHQKLCSQKAIDALYTNGKGLFHYPFKLKYTITTHNANAAVQYIIVVPKRIFKKASDRNKVKRLIKEGLRLQQANLQAALLTMHQSLQLHVLYTQPDILSFETMNERCMKLMNKLTVEISKLE